MTCGWFMPAPAVALVAIVTGVILLILGLLNLGYCSDGVSLILFGAAIMAVGVGAGVVGGIPVTVGATLFGVLLVIVGLVLEHGAACAINL